MKRVLKLQTEQGSIHYWELVVMLAFLSALGALTIDLQLPAMPLILNAFGIIEANRQQWIITAYMLGFASVQIFYGPLSDSFGRKPILMFGLCLYVAASILCLFAPSYFWFLLFRALQGVGGAAARIVINAITRDFFKGDQMAKVTSLVMLIFIMVPVFAPTIGSVLLWFAPWQSILYCFVLFGVFVLLWCYFRLPESLHRRDKAQLNIRQLWLNLKAVISEPMSMNFAVVSGLVFSGFMAYLNSSEQIFSQIYQAHDLFPVLFGVIALFFGVAGFINAKIVTRFGVMKVTFRALSALLISNVFFIVISVYFDGLPPLWLFVTAIGIINVCVGMVFGNVMAIAMWPLGRVAGMGASIVGTISSVLAAGIGALISQQLSNHIYPIAIGFAVSAVIAWLMVFKYRKLVLKN